VPIRATREALTRGAARAGQSLGLAALALLLGNNGLQNAVANGDTRTISLHHMHTGEDLTVTFKRNGRYDEEALKKVNHVLRDWRRDEEIAMDPHLLDVVWEVYREVDAKVPIQVVCGYRAPATNAMLRKRSRGVAQHSQHTLGHAMDFYIPGVPLEKQREAGLRLQRGGVGYYPSSGSPFVHLDVGSVRHWPRMTRDQLAKVFPDGRTVHVPTDGRPLAGYALALADIQNRGSSEPSQTSLAAARDAGVNVDAAMPAAPRQRNLFTALFTKDEDEDSEPAAAAPAPKAEAKPEKKPSVKVAEARQAAPKPAEQKNVPLPVARPTQRIAAQAEPKTAPAPSFNLASAESRPVTPTGTITDVIASRGFWDPRKAEAAPPKQPTQVAAATPAAAPAETARTAETTGAVAPWPMKTADASGQVPAGLALAYAAQNPAPATRSLSAPARNAAATPPTRVADASNRTASIETTTGVGATSRTLKRTTPPDDLWLRALVLAPDLQNYLTATVMGQADMRELQPLMDKPDAVVTMAFGDNPHLGLATDRFTGGAVVFVPTTIFEKRQTAALQ
jgi:uncharacterized protein YcbK (DUF882 family)